MKHLRLVGACGSIIASLGFATSIAFAVTSSDISIVKTGPALVNKGGNVVYTMTAKNAGPSVADGVVVTDALPAGTSFVAANSFAGCSESDDIVTCSLGTLTVNQTRSFVLTLKASATSCNTIVNTGIISSLSQDPNNANNTSTARTSINGCPAAADVSIKKISPASASYGANLTYTIVVKNNGPDTAQNITVTDAVPRNLVYNDAASFAACFDAGDDIINCPVGTLAAGTQKTFTVTFRPYTCEAVYNTAVVSTTAQDTNGSNDTSTAFVNVNCPAQ